MPAAGSQDLRGALDAYERAGELLRVREPVHWRFEAAAVLWRLAQGPAVRFEQVPGYRVPLVGNVVNRRDKLALALGVPAAELQARMVGALEHRIGAEVTEDAPCQEVVAGDTDLLARFPVPHISEHDAGRYLSAGLVVARDPASGRRNLAIARLLARGDGRLGAYFAPTHSYQFLQGYRERRQPMEVAVAIGNHPALLVASQLLVPHDELEVAGALLGEPVRLARCRTVDLEVPAAAEIVLEGTIDPEELEPEGPFGEFPGQYAPARPNPVVRLTAITHRRDPLLQMIVGGNHPEHLILGALAREATLYRSVKAVVPGTRQVALTEGGCCRFHAVVSLRKRVPGEGKLAILAALGSQDLLKLVTAVDDDVDPTDPREVEWALATRMRAGEDLVVVPGVKSNPVDPMAVDRTVTKLGIDATLPVGAGGEARQRPGVPAAVRRSIDDRWDRISGGQD